MVILKKCFFNFSLVQTFMEYKNLKIRNLFQIIEKKMCSNNKILKYDDEYSFETGDEFSDMKLIIEDKILHVHKAILGILTIVFSFQFIHNF
jgi:hypothetical protein